MPDCAICKKKTPANTVCFKCGKSLCVKHRNIKKTPDGKKHLGYLCKPCAEK